MSNTQINLGVESRDLLASAGGLRCHGCVRKWLNRRNAVHLGIAAFFIALFIGLTEAARWGVIVRGYDSLESATVDYRVKVGRRAPVSPEIVFLSLDIESTGASLESMFDAQTLAASRPLSLMHSRFPYPREVYSLICDKLFDAGAKAVALDVLFLGPTDDDTIWAASLEKYRDQLVVGMNIDVDKRADAKTSTAMTLSMPSSTLLPDEDPFDSRLGYVNYWQDADDIVREAEYETNIDYLNGKPGADKKPMYYSLVARLLHKSGHEDLVPNDPKPRTMRFAGPPLTPFHHFPIYTVFDPDRWAKDFQNGEFFRDKIVLIGPLGDFNKDKSSTPYGLMDGAEIHLNALNDALENQFLQRPSRTLTCICAVLAGLVAFALAALLPGIGWRFLAALTAFLAYRAVLLWAYDSPGLLLPAVAPLGVFFGTTGTGFIYDFVLTQIEKLRLRTTFERYNSKNVVKYLLENTESYKEMLAGTRKPVTVLFSDIRSFTSIVETTPDSHELVLKLNEYFTEMVDCVFRFDGSLDKFMGDGIMAIWGNTPYNFGPDGDAVRAVRAALAMVDSLHKLNTKWVSEGKTKWQFGIGLNHGQVIVGDMGSQQHKEFGVVGDAINLGSRLEGLTKKYHLQIILGESVADLVRDKFYLRSVDIVKVTGKTMAVRAYTVLGEKTDPMQIEEKKFLALYEEGISSFRRRDFIRAREHFEQALQIHSDDFLAMEYLKTSIAYIENPPDESWTGIRVMTEK